MKTRDDKKLLFRSPFQRSWHISMITASIHGAG